MAKSFLRNKLLDFVGLQTPTARLIVFGAITVILFIISFQDLSRGPTLSLWSRLGMPSPSIGLTRAYWHLIHGRFSDAWEMNRLVYLVSAIVLFIVISDIRKILLKKKNSG